ncbi:MAG: YwiC-like family protein [Gemmatimonadetes bacterium]|nr:YwiC-like family protein [Gemmatimonadota bacterium]MBT6146343.1 YwiC-like family protein [Gemmatimonadota bacterium]MBT7858919.1 YwiC-like family protein [Gemmatimonadota bacterium]
MSDRPAARRGAPLPREHGAWVMLYAPLLTGLVVYPVGWFMSLLLAVLATSAFFAQNALGLLLRGRGDGRTWRWLAACGALVGVSAAAYWGAGHARVLWLGLPAALLFSWQALQRRLTRRQIDHSLANELITVPILGLGAPAAHIISAGQMTPGALLPSVAFSLYFAGSVFFVKMLIGAIHDPAPAPLRWRRGGATLLYHGFILLALLAGIGGLDNGRILIPGLIGFLPVVARTLFMWWRLSGVPPSLRRVGFIEVGIALWFSIWIGVFLTHWERMG